MESVGGGEVVGGRQIYPFVGRWVLGGRVQLAAGEQDDLVGLVGFVSKCSRCAGGRTLARM